MARTVVRALLPSRQPRRRRVAAGARLHDGLGAVCGWAAERPFVFLEPLRRLAPSPPRRRRTVGRRGPSRCSPLVARRRSRPTTDASAAHIEGPRALAPIAAAAPTCARARRAGALLRRRRRRRARSKRILPRTAPNAVAAACWRRRSTPPRRTLYQGAARRLPRRRRRRARRRAAAGRGDARSGHAPPASSASAAEPPLSAGDAFASHVLLLERARAGAAWAHDHLQTLLLTASCGDVLWGRTLAAVLYAALEDESGTAMTAAAAAARRRRCSTRRLHCPTRARSSSAR